MAPREGLEDFPPPASAWFKIAAAVLGGSILWTAVAAISHRRYPYISVAIALIVSCFVVWALGMRFDTRVALIAALASMLSLVIGEFLIQILFRLGTIKTLDFKYNTENQTSFYMSFMLRFVVLRILVPGAVAFLIGLWPLRNRPAWRGFGGKGDRPSDALIRPGGN